jgi:uncharacterized protein
MLLQKSNTTPLYVAGTVQRRLESVDILRGIALLGVFITHFICQFYGLAFTPAPVEAVITTPLDPFFEKLLAAIFFDKARGIFSFLFGVGFYFQLAKMAKPGVNFNAYFIKRLTILFIFGLIHYYFLFKGDVLRFYAVLGLLLLMCYKLNERVLLIASFLFAAIIPSLCNFFENDLFIGDFNTPATIAIFGHFLFGFWVAKRGIFFNLFAHRVHIRNVFVCTLILNVFLYAVRTLVKVGAAKGFYEITPLSQDLLDITFMLGIQAMILTSISGVLLLYMNTTWKKRLLFFVPAGQMTVTNYIMQSVFAILIFKLGVYEQLGTVASFSACVGLCLLQAYYSKWWLSHFNSGPLELVWRKLTSIHLRRETFLRQPGRFELKSVVEETTFKGITFIRQNAFVSELQQKKIKGK